MYLPWNASKARVREAENARKNRMEIVQALSHGQVSRRDLMKWGLFTTAGFLVPKQGLSPFATSVYADGGGGGGGGNIPTGAPRSPLFGVQPFTQPMPRFDVLPRKSPLLLSPAPTAESNQTLQAMPAVLGGGYGPIEGRPPGPIWAHQRWSEFPCKVAVEAT